MAGVSGADESRDSVVESGSVYTEGILRLGRREVGVEWMLVGLMPCCSKSVVSGSRDGFLSKGPESTEVLRELVALDSCSGDGGGTWLISLC